MLSYLHGFHAGGAADVLKHSLLVFCLSYLKKKEKPLLCVDTHAGAGLYDLAGNREWWEKGLGLLLQSSAEYPPMIDAYVKLSGNQTRCAYSGSPLIMAKMLAKGDRLVCFELHPREAEALKASIQELRDKGRLCIEVRREDGPAGLKSLLPPASRRALIHIDPSWEEQSEYESIPRAVQGALKRFPEGTFIVWYPLLALPKEKAAGLPPLPDTLFGLSDGKRCRAELYTDTAGNSPRGMYGSGLVVFNPPWTLRAALEETLPYLAKVLGQGNWRFEWEG